MDRRNFLKSGAVLGGAAFLGSSHSMAQVLATSSFSTADKNLWFNKSMRWAQLAFVENDPGNYDPEFWLNYFKKIHADGVLLSAGGVVAFYPTEIPLHHRSAWLGDSDPLGYLVEECRKMDMSVILRTDPHAARQNVVEGHPDWIAVDAEGEKRRHWANPDLWVTCALGPYNFDFMAKVNQEIMERYQPDAIFSNRWSGHGICYCQHCVSSFKAYSGYELPISTSSALSTAMASGDPADPAYRSYVAWRTEKLKDLWYLWDGQIRKIKPTARYIPNGFPDKLLTGKNSDFFFADQQARSGVIPPWTNGKHAKELRATMGMKPQVGIFSVGLEEPYRWKDSVQSDAEIKVWVAEGTANGLLPCFVKFGGVIFDTRWMDAVAKIYQNYHRIEPYLRNTAPIARVGMVYSEQTNRLYGGQKWQQQPQSHSLGMYHSLIESRIPFEMVHDQLLALENIKNYKLLILPNIAVLSSRQCQEIEAFVKNGGSILATYETSLYDESGKQKSDFGLSALFGVNYAGGVEGPMQNSYLRLKPDAGTKKFHPVTEGLEKAYRIINGTHRVMVAANTEFPVPVTLVPSYPDLPMEDVYLREPESDIPELYLRETGNSRVAFFPWDIDRVFWQIMSQDHGRLLQNTIKWALNEPSLVDVKAPGILDVTLWRQQNSMTVHLVNLTNPMMMKGPFRELIPVDAEINVQIPAGKKLKNVHLLIGNKKPEFKLAGSRLEVKVPKVFDHEIIALDLA